MQEYRFYRRNLPHYQKPHSSYFVTFRTWERWILPTEVRNIALDCCRFVHERTAILHCAAIMPDHIHLVLTPLDSVRESGSPLEGILHGIKGVSGKRINKALSRTGNVWQPESFDHLLRNRQSAMEKIEYVLDNPLRKGLVRRREDYPWLWHLEDEE